MVWAVGRAQYQVIATDAHGREHVLGELRPVPGPFEQGPFGQHRRMHTLAPVCPSDVSGEAFEFVADDRPVRQPQRQARAHHRIGGEDLQITVELAMIRLRRGVLIVVGHENLLGRVPQSREPRYAKAPEPYSGAGFYSQCNTSAPEWIRRRRLLHTSHRASVEHALREVLGPDETHENCPRNALRASPGFARETVSLRGHEE